MELIDLHFMLTPGIRDILAGLRDRFPSPAAAVCNAQAAVILLARDMGYTDDQIIDLVAEIQQSLKMPTKH